MEILNTIRNNITLASTWEIDWSPDGGMLWFTMMFVGFIATVAFAASSEN
jgi:hypothetical protein